MKCGPCSYATEAHVIEWQRFPQNASELDHITAVFVTATSATPQNPKMVPDSNIHTITPQNPRFGLSCDALTGCYSMRDRSFSFSSQPGHRGWWRFTSPQTARNVDLINPTNGFRVPTKCPTSRPIHSN